MMRTIRKSFMKQIGMIHKMASAQESGGTIDHHFVRCDTVVRQAWPLFALLH
jgi:hypothetical protein